MWHIEYRVFHKASDDPDPELAHVMEYLEIQEEDRETKTKEIAPE